VKGTNSGDRGLDSLAGMNCGGGIWADVCVGLDAGYLMGCIWADVDAGYLMGCIWADVCVGLDVGYLMGVGGGLSMSDEEPPVPLYVGELLRSA
jgi:hypothetical protein